MMFSWITGLSNAQIFDIMIAKEDPDVYHSLQAAINHIPDNSTLPYRIFIKNGIYNEKVQLPASKTNVCLIGESADGVIITYNDYSGKDGISTATSYTFLAEGNDLYAENITFQNTAGSIAQAVAIRTTGDRQVFKNCRFIGFQDTYYAHKNRQYNLNCTVEGATDFIFGDATAVFDSCTIICVKGGQYVTAPSDTKLTSVKTDGSTFYHGLQFRRSVITCNDDVSAASYYLGRPWQPNASSVYISCVLDHHIKPAGWSIWSGTDNHLSGYYGEYLSRDPGGDLVDTTMRVPWSHQISQEDAATYYALNYFFKKQDVEWDPVPKTLAFNAPTDLSFKESRLAWQTDVQEGTGFVVIRNDSVIGFTDTTWYDDPTADFSRTNIYKVKSVAPYGNLSLPSEEYVVSASAVKPVLNSKPVILINLKDGILSISENADVTIFNHTGMPVINRNNTAMLSLQDLQKGVYIVKAVNRKGTIQVQKIIL
jgi:pectinesterase